VTVCLFCYQAGPRPRVTL